MGSSSVRRPPRGLTRQRIVQAALAIADRDGADALSMRRLADALSVTPMALYNHVPDKKALLVDLAQHVLKGMRFDAPQGEWRERIRFAFIAMRSVCLRHPATVRLMEMAEMMPAGVFAPMDLTLTVLREIGIEGEDALRCYFTLVGFTLAQVGSGARAFSYARPHGPLAGGKRTAAAGVGFRRRLCLWPDPDSRRNRDRSASRSHEPEVPNTFVS